MSECSDKVLELKQDDVDGWILPAGRYELSQIPSGPVSFTIFLEAEDALRVARDILEYAVTSGCADGAGRAGTFQLDLSGLGIFHEAEAMSEGEERTSDSR